MAYIEKYQITTICVLIHIYMTISQSETCSLHLKNEYFFTWLKVKTILYDFFKAQYINVPLNLSSFHIYALQLWVCTSRHLNLYKLEHVDIWVICGTTHVGQKMSCRMSCRTSCRTCVSICSTWYKFKCLLVHTQKFKGINVIWSQVKGHSYILRVSLMCVLTRTKTQLIEWTNRHWVLEYPHPLQTQPRRCTTSIMPNPLSRNQWPQHGNLFS